MHYTQGMNMNDFANQVAARMAGGQSQGQACYNVLFDFRPERANEVLGTALDPYNQPGTRGEFWDGFDNWLRTWCVG